jgi:hypothetical protein
MLFIAYFWTELRTQIFQQSAQTLHLFATWEALLWTISGKKIGLNLGVEIINKYYQTCNENEIIIKYYQTCNEKFK